MESQNIQTLLQTSNSPLDVISADFNQDAIADLAVVSSSDNTLGIFLGRADGTFAAQETYQTGTFPNALVILAINPGSIQDVFISSSQSPLHLGLLAGGFSPALLYDKPGRSPVAVDFSKDYMPDIIMLSGDSLELIERQYCAP